ncbi:MAG: protein TolR [Gammaproteobacteria bacterium]|nr:protein TolR [Gammaproteobacteria bacterium]
MRNRARRNRPMAEINVVPYIDVMLVLLVIFMITAPLLSQGVTVDLPHAAAQPLSAKEQGPIIVSVDSKGNYYLNVSNDPHRAIAPLLLANRVAAELQVAKNAGHKREVLVKGDRNVNYGKVVQAMVLLQHAGAPSVGLMTEDSKQK